MELIMNVNRRSCNIARVNRNVLPPEELYTIDVQTGKRIPKTTWCDYHKEYEFVGNFYLESKSKRKHKYDLRNMCIPAWDEVEGKIPDKLNQINKINSDEDVATLVMFMENCDD